MTAIREVGRLLRVACCRSPSGSDRAMCGRWVVRQPSRSGVCGDAANLDDLDRLFDTVKREKGKIDILFANAGTGEAVPLGEVRECV